MTLHTTPKDMSALLNKVALSDFSKEELQFLRNLVVDKMEVITHMIDRMEELYSDPMPALYTDYQKAFTIAQLWVVQIENALVAVKVETLKQSN
jgi:hypothetical protein